MDERFTPATVVGVSRVELPVGQGRNFRLKSGVPIREENIEMRRGNWRCGERHELLFRGAGRIEYRP